MAKFFCEHCRYKFEAQEQPKTCPYCNEATISEEKSAGEIVNEVSDMLED
jgi:rubrerythrin